MSDNNWFIHAGHAKQATKETPLRLYFKPRHGWRDIEFVDKARVLVQDLTESMAKEIEACFAREADAAAEARATYMGLCRAYADVRKAEVDVILGQRP